MAKFKTTRSYHSRHRYLGQLPNSILAMTLPFYELISVKGILELVAPADQIGRSIAIVADRMPLLYCYI